jgi:hypothetical protein
MSETKTVEATAVAVASSGYDSRPATYAHIGVVRRYLGAVAADLIRRGDEHDASKLLEPEVSVFDEYTPKLGDSTYGSEEYKSCLAEMGTGLLHHYAANPHHPEHYEEGIREMSLMDITEMLCDWKAATERHAEGDLARSIEHNQARYGYSDDLKRILTNTAYALGFTTDDAQASSSKERS